MEKRKTKMQRIKRIYEWFFSVFNPSHSTFEIRHSTRAGFTLVETLIAITILLISVVGPISLIGDALQKLYYARDEMIAINLAQEGIEVVRYVRDSNMIAGNSPWKDLNPGGPKMGYIIDAAQVWSGTVSNFVKKCNGSNCTEAQAVVMNTTSGLYQQDVPLGATVKATPFMRFVEIEDFGIPDERKVTSTVTWKTAGQSGTIVVSENLFKLTP